MGNKLLDGLKEETNFTKTENDCLTLKSTLSGVLDFYSRAGAFRERSNDDIISSFVKAFAEDKALALKCLFHLRDIRGGQGERRTFRVILNYLGRFYPEIVNKNIENVPFYGRWDDLNELLGTKSESVVINCISKQLESDMSSDRISLLAKWLKSENKGSKNQETARYLRKALGYTSKEYRKILSRLRERIRVVEREMCSNKWNEIEYSLVPSNASMRYAKAFKNHDQERYSAYIEEVKSGKAKINAKTIYPYEFIRKIDQGLVINDSRDTLNVLWKALPNYCTKQENVLVLCDTSGSMTCNGGLPLYTSISLSIYFAERNTGVFKDYFMGFSREPTLYHLEGENIFEKYNCLRRVNSAHENTDLIECFKLILCIAKKYNVPEEEMPKKLLMITDMEFDQASNDNSSTAFQTIDKLYQDAGYKRPLLVFWNVNARNNHSAAQMDDRGVFLVSGSSPVAFKHVMETKAFTPVELMLDVLNSDRYNRVKI